MNSIRSTAAITYQKLICCFFSMTRLLEPYFCGPTPKETASSMLLGERMPPRCKVWLLHRPVEPFIYVAAVCSKSTARFPPQVVAPFRPRSVGITPAELSFTPRASHAGPQTHAGLGITIETLLYEIGNFMIVTNRCLKAKNGIWYK